MFKRVQVNFTIIKWLAYGDMLTYAPGYSSQEFKPVQLINNFHPDKYTL
ncbi:hypothetical protein [Mucilaginibacter phyllosphaerae]|uniref:Uncharacterized protein n=1 Tax=Mucilaginibacter phyllosphaerae TaxID=1812349 RepID=A0ABR6I760_9SPHI|nr:hypothetical protein [Mucilaginibacter phyllosphaerae]MBB3968853.1 hypothetical protein [Mucilaginibacter phyllosphaerae]